VTADLMLALPAIANRLRAHVAAGLPLSGLGEMGHLEPAAVGELGRAFPSRVEKNRKVAIPAWSTVGNVDLIIRASPGSQRLTHVIELKWCPSHKGTLYEGIWDLFKMALASTRSEAPHAYLIAGAPMSAWAADFCRDLYDSTVHSAVELCERRFLSGSRRLAWDDLLEGGYDRYPQMVPARIRTESAGRESLADASEQWELRAVQVSIDGTGCVPFLQGWPFGTRPEGALRPLS